MILALGSGVIERMVCMPVSNILASVGLALATSRRARPTEPPGVLGKVSFWHWRKARSPSLALDGAQAARGEFNGAAIVVKEER